MNFLHNQAEAYQEYQTEKRGYVQAVEDYLTYCKKQSVSSLSALQQVYDIFGNTLSKDELKQIQRTVYGKESKRQDVETAKNIKERYGKITKSSSFKAAYQDKSLGDFMEVDE